jgi:hypothetical protein
VKSVYDSVPSSLVIKNTANDDGVAHESVDQEPWVIRGGVIGEMHNLLLHNSAALDMFAPRPIPAPSERTYSVRLANTHDTVSVDSIYGSNVVLDSTI